MKFSDLYSESVGFLKICFLITTSVAGIFFFKKIKKQYDETYQTIHNTIANVQNTISTTIDDISTRVGNVATAVKNVLPDVHPEQYSNTVNMIYENTINSLTSDLTSELTPIIVENTKNSLMRSNQFELYDIFVNLSENKYGDFSFLLKYFEPNDKCKEFTFGEINRREFMYSIAYPYKTNALVFSRVGLSKIYDLISVYVNYVDFGI